MIILNLAYYYSLIFSKAKSLRVSDHMLASDTFKPQSGVQLLSIVKVIFSSVVRYFTAWCLDGKGGQVLSALLILQHLLECYKNYNKLDVTPHPYEVFDLAGGTGTGG